MTALLDSEFLTELCVLERRLNLRARSGLAGETLARHKGSSAEFEQHRPYVAGDDTRRIDWLAMARSGAPVLKQFRSEEDPVVQVLLDRSASLALGTPTKLWLAQRLCAAVGYLALQHGARLQLISAPGKANDDVTFHARRRGRNTLARYLAELSASDAQGETHLVEWVERITTSTRRAGLLVVVSDFFDPEPVLRQLDLARAQGHDVALAQVLSREEIEPELEGDVELIDAETDARVALTVDGRALEAYRAALAGLCQRLGAWCRQRGHAYVRVASEAQLLPALGRLVRRQQD
jgi:uncharacterized protein (DUF58 family)